MVLNRHSIQINRLQHILLSFLLLLMMCLLLGVLAWLIFGNYGIFFFLIGIITLIILHPSVSHKLHLRIRGATEINKQNAPTLYYMFLDLVEKTKLNTLPALYHIPENILNAFSIGSKKNTSIVLTTAIINYLNPRELQGVIAHEISHIKNNDIWHMGLAHTVYRLILWLSYLGLLFLFVQLLPFIFGQTEISYLPALIILAAPLLSTFLFSALSRTREYNADIGAVYMTGDIRSFTSALKKLTLQPFRLFGLILIPGTKKNNTSLLQTHPAIRHRIRKLEKLDWDKPVEKHRRIHYFI